MPRHVVASALGPIENYALQAFTPTPPRADEIQIEVKATGVSFVDVLVAAGRYQVKPDIPFTPGSECAGIVQAIGSDVTGIAIGDRIIATGWHGLFADVATMPAKAAWPMPSTLSFAEAAVLLVSYATAFHALVDRGHLQHSETLLVLGAGGATGYAALQVGSHLGARVIASASSGAKRALAISAGAKAAIDPRAPNWRELVKAANNGKPIDVIFDPVGGAATEPAFRSLGWNGRHLIVGFPGGIASLATNLPLLKSASLVGVNLGQLGSSDPQLAHDNHLRVLELASQQQVKPVISRTYPLEQFAAAMQAAANGDTAGRIVLTMD